MPARRLARALLIMWHPTNAGGQPMHARERLTQHLKEHLRQRELRPQHRQLAFAYKGHVIELAVDESLYRGPFVSVLERGRPVREFRAQGGHYDWDAIAAAVIDVAEGRVAHG